MAKDNKALLEEYLADPKKKLQKEYCSHEMTSYTFEDWVKDDGDVVHTRLTVFRIDGNVVSMFHRNLKSQKFLCIGGPLAGKKATENDATGYMVYNCATFNRGSRDPEIPKAILVYRKSLQLAKKSH